jgi:predicted deacylase
MSGNSSILSKKPNPLTDFKSRIIAEIGGKNSGELLCVVCGIHGNEISGVKAVERIVKEVKPLEERLNGKIIFIREKSGLKTYAGSGRPARW